LASVEKSASFLSFLSEIGYLVLMTTTTTKGTRFRAEYRLEGDYLNEDAWIYVGTYDTRKEARLELSHARACEHETRITTTDYQGA
jgi:uncharacterized protein YmfQ (DUF2313 family)